MNPEVEEGQGQNLADSLRENAQIAEYSAQENARLQNKRMRNLASFKKERGGPIDPQLTLSVFGLMLGVAIFFDAISFGLNFIPLIGGLLQVITVTPVATLTFAIWLKMHGINFTKGPRGFFILLTAIIGFIPVVNALPEWTVYVIGLYLSGSKISTTMQKSLNKVHGK